MDWEWIAAASEAAQRYGEDLRRGGLREGVKGDGEWETLVAEF